MYKSTMVEQQDEAPPEISEEGGYKFIRKDGEIVVQAANGKEYEPRIPQQGDFDANLAELMEESELTQIASRLIEYFDTDKASRQDWERSEEQALMMMGVKEVPDDSGYLPGIHKVVHPLLAEAAVRSQALSIAEIFPDTGPVKTRIFGKETVERRQQAQRIEDFGNYYLTEVDTGYFDDTDQMLLYLPLCGSAFRKGGINWTTGMPEMRYIKATNFVAPYHGRTLEGMSRYCHWYTMAGQDIDAAIDLGLWRDVGLVQAPQDGEGNTKTEDTSDNRTPSTHEDDDIHTIYEYHVNIGIQFDGQNKKERLKVLPYIVVMDRDSEQVLMVRRNWKEGDSKRKKRVWFAHHKFMQGLGFYGWGYLHVIGSLLRAVSGSLNALLDSAYAANFQGGFKTKEGRAVGDVTLEHGVWKDVDATFDDLSKSFYTPPFREPSAALAQLLEGLVNSGQRFMSTVDVAVGDARNDAPVGTTIALIEESQRVMAAVHKRIHKSMGFELRIWAELVHDVMPSRYDYDQNDETKYLLKEDFDGRVDVVPVTNPNLASNTQRLATSQLVMDTITNNPDLFNKQKRIAAIRRMWTAAKVPDIEEIAPEADKPLYIDPVSESLQMMTGKAVKAFEYQDHKAHIAVHKHHLAYAQATMDAQAFDVYANVAIAHLREHEALEYRALVMQSAQIAPPPLGVDGLPMELDPETEAMLSVAVAQALPPLPAPPSQDQGDGQQVLDKAAAGIQAKQMEAQAKVARDEEAFIAAEKRKEEEHQQKLRRQREEANLEESRKDQQAATDLIRQKAKAKGDMEIQRAKGALSNALSARQADMKIDSAKKAADAKAKQKPKPKK